METKVSKCSIFTPKTLEEILQNRLRQTASMEMLIHYGVLVKDRQKGKNHDLTVAEYKVAKEEEKIEKLSTDKIGLEADILVLNHKKYTKQKKLDGRLKVPISS